jgi:hypothetical protein
VAPSRPPTAARKAQVLGLQKRSGRETDCPLEGDGFELPVPRENSCPVEPSYFAYLIEMFEFCRRASFA